MSAEGLEGAEKKVNRFLKITAYILSFFISLAASIFAASVSAVIVYRLTSYNDELSFRTFLIVVPLTFILLAWLAAPRLVRLLLKDLRRPR